MKVLLLFSFMAFSNCPTILANQELSSAEIPEDYIIGLEDVLSIDVWKERDLSIKEVIVRPDGKIGMPLVGDIQASGLTPMQLQEQIAEKMKESDSWEIDFTKLLRLTFLKFNSILEK